MLAEDFSRNQILAGLPRQERDRLLPASEVVQVHLGETLAEFRTPLRFIHFPLNSAISMTATQDHERMVEVTLTGKEGSSGSSVVLGDRRSLCTAMIQIPGVAVRIPTSSIIEELSQLPCLEAALSRHNSLLLQTAVVSVGCSRFHTVPQRVARWLKAHWYRSGIETFPFSAQFLAAQVGAEPQAVGEVLKALSQNGLLKLGHNQVTIADHDALSKQACECFELARQASEDYISALGEISRAHRDS